MHPFSYRLISCPEGETDLSSFCFSLSSKQYVKLQTVLSSPPQRQKSADLFWAHFNNPTCCESSTLILYHYNSKYLSWVDMFFKYRLNCWSCQVGLVLIHNLSLFCAFLSIFYQVWYNQYKDLVKITGNIYSNLCFQLTLEEQKGRLNDNHLQPLWVI